MRFKLFCSSSLRRFADRSDFEKCFVYTENQKQGYATAAIRLMIDYCFETLGLNQIYSSVPSGNIGSRKLFEKLGFVQTGYRKNWLRRGNGWEDIVYFQLLNQ